MNFTIVSWNILANEFIEKQYYPNFNYDFLTNRLVRMKIIAHQMETQNADIFLLQEVMKNEYRYLKRRFRQYSFSKLCPIEWDLHSESGNVILFRSALFSITSSQSLIYLNRIFGQHICLKHKQQEFHILNIHLNDIYFQKRKAQIKTILPILKNNSRVILGGDFNQNYNQNPSLFSVIPEYTIHNKNMTYYIESFMNIDNILTKGFKGTISKKIDYTRIPKDELLETFASDHLPVIAQINLVS